MAPRDTDLPSQTLAVSLVNGPSGLVVTNGVVAWTPTEAQGPSTNTIVVRVTDGVATVTNAFVILVQPGGVASGSGAERGVLLTKGAIGATSDLLRLHIVLAPNGQVTIRPESAVPADFDIESSDDLLHWTPTAPSGSGATRPVLAEDPSHAEGRRFYRLRRRQESKP